MSARPGWRSTAARAADAFPSGVIFVDLTPVTDPRLVLPTIARALSLRVEEDAPLIDRVVETLELVSGFCCWITSNRVLSGATDVAQLLSRCAGLTVLATSRQPLQLRLEREYVVSPLVLPGPRCTATAG